MAAINSLAYLLYSVLTLAANNEPTTDPSLNRKLESGGCPHQRICSLSCHNQGYSYGLCLGPKKMDCHCMRNGRAEDYEEPRDKLDSDGCPNQRACSSNCEDKDYEYGLCYGPDQSKCRCYNKLNSKESEESEESRGKLESGGCPHQRACSLHCYRQGYKKGLCTGPGKMNCQCIGNSGAEDSEGPTDKSESDGCPNQPECSRNCVQKGYKYGLCFGPARDLCRCFRKVDTDESEGPRVDPELLAQDYPDNQEAWQVDQEPPVTEWNHYENEEDLARRCPGGEIWSQCDAGCQDTCKNVGEPKICPQSCVPGCVCKPGTVRSPRGRCILPSRCPPKPETARPEKFASYGCPTVSFLCYYFCVTQGKSGGRCNESTCECY